MRYISYNLEDTMSVEDTFETVRDQIVNLFGDDYSTGTIRHHYDLYVDKHPEADISEIKKGVTTSLVKGRKDTRSRKK